MPFGMGDKRRRDIPGAGKEELVGFLESGVDGEGKLTVTTPEALFRINSHFKGEIDCEGHLVVAEQGDVEAEIHSRVVSIYGKVKGSVHARERLDIKEHGIVLGDIYTPCLVVDPGGYFDGQSHMPAQEPSGQTTDRGGKGHG
jgi:cytoskeletal protein CcmA (bactofilin family)